MIPRFFESLKINSSQKADMCHLFRDKMLILNHNVPGQGVRLCPLGREVLIVGIAHTRPEREGGLAQVYSTER